MSDPNEYLIDARAAAGSMKPDTDVLTEAGTVTVQPETLDAAYKLKGAFEALDLHLSAGAYLPADWDRLGVRLPSCPELAQVITQVGIYDRPAMSAEALAGLILTHLLGGET